MNSTDYEMLFQQAPCGYLVLDDSGVVTAANDTFLLWTGHGRDDVVGTALARFLPVGDRILYSTHCSPLLRMSGAFAEFRCEVLGADGVRRPVLLSATRTSGPEARGATTRMIVFNAHERGRYEQELITAVRRADRSETRLVDAQAGLDHLALHDPLTGLRNRAGVMEVLAVRITEQTGSAPAPGVLVVDVDHLLAVNESLGDAAGDELLTVIARRLSAAVRGEATVARISGDKFVVVDGLRDADEAAVLAARLLHDVTTPLVLDGLEIAPSASVGVALSTGTEDSASALLHHADLAMHRARARGTNTWELHTPGDAASTSNRLRVLGELRTGIVAGELTLHYQPQVHVTSGTVSGVEALVRWQHPTRGLLFPADFIDVAEESGLVSQLGAWVLDEAIAQAARWSDLGAGTAPLDMSINISARQLTDLHLVDVVAAALARHGLAADRLILEITETALVEDTAGGLAVLDELKALGVALSVDDFGTGYAGLTNLRRFPVDELKIDRSFVAGLGTSPEDSAIVASCVHLAHTLGLRAVAEGVEDDHQLAALAALGCDVVQGYGISRPVPPDALVAWLGTREAASGPASMPR